jgi:hypothetical protein
MPCVLQSAPESLAEEHDQVLHHQAAMGSGSTRFTALVQQRRPRCLQGQAFARLFSMRAQCPACGLLFEREPGYFTGAMYLSYGLALITTANRVIILFPSVGNEADRVESA